MKQIEKKDTACTVCGKRLGRTKTFTLPDIPEREDELQAALDREIDKWLAQPERCGAHA